MKKTRFLGVGALALTATLALAACSQDAPDGGSTDGGTAAAGGSQVIGVIPKSTLYDYWKSVEIGAANAAQEHGYTIQFQGTATDTDTEGQVQIVEDFISRGVAAIVISPVSADALVPALEQANAAGIPVVIIDGSLNSDVPVTTISTDNVAAASIAAEKMHELLGGSGKVAVVSEVAGSIQGAAREQGFIDTITGYGYDLLTTFYSEGDRNQALSITQDALSANADLAGIFTTNEGATVGTTLGVTAAGKVGDVTVIGFDSSEDILQAIADGVLTGTIAQDPAGIGYMGVTSAVAAIDGEDVEDHVDVPAVYVDGSNVDSPDVQQILRPERVS